MRETLRTPYSGAFFGGTHCRAGYMQAANAQIVAKFKIFVSFLLQRSAKATSWSL